MNNGTNTGANGSNSNNDAIVKLNIGGYKYVTTKATLLAQEDNFFTALLKGSIPSLQDEGNEIRTNYSLIIYNNIELLFLVVHL
jgi:hypothetical protein